ncbi:MAG: ABC transporter permease [Vicinamibacterales bacterium]
MIRFLARRLIVAILLVLVVSSAALWLTRLAPGDLTSSLVLAPADEIARVRARFGLDLGFLEQWGIWIAQAARFDFGESFLYNRPVGGLVGQSALNTAALALAALALATVVGIPLGVFTGSRHGGLLPSAVGGLSVLCLSLPPLLTSLVLVWIAARTGWFPVGGMSSVDAGDMAWGGWIADLAWHLPLPAVALALPVGAMLERLQSQSIGEAVRQPYVAAALARGLSHEQLVLRHAWRASLRPVCAFYGLVIGALLSGSFAVEYVTAWPGLGRLMYEALRARDIYLVAGCAAAGALFLALGSLISDLLLAAADPRIRDADAS